MDIKPALKPKSLEMSCLAPLKSQRKNRRAKYRAKRRREFVASLSALYNPLDDGNRSSPNPPTIYMKSSCFNPTLMEIKSLQDLNPDFAKDFPSPLSSAPVRGHEFIGAYSNVPKRRLNLQS